MNRLALAIRPGMANTSATVMDMEGDLDMSTVEEFDSKFQELIKQKRYKIVLNMKKLVYVSSNGFGAIMGAIRDAKANNGELKIADISPEVLEVFRMLELPNLCQISKTEDEAVRAF